MIILSIPYTSRGFCCVGMDDRTSDFFFFLGGVGDTNPTIVHEH